MDLRTSIWAARWKTASGLNSSNAGPTAAESDDVHLAQRGARLQRAGEVLALAAGQIVEDQDLVSRRQQGVHQVRSDEACAACDEGPHGLSLAVSPGTPRRETGNRV